MAADPKPFHVLVIGGGSCGLTLAQGLQKAGISYTLYERDTATDFHVHPRDWGSMLHWGQKYLERCLPDDLWKRRTEMWADQRFDYDNMPEVVFYNAENSEEIKRIPAPPAARVSRAKIRKFLSQGLNIEYDKRLAAVEEGQGVVTARFDDGAVATGNLIIGCDGGHSVTRRFVVGDEAAKGFDTGHRMINTRTKYPHNRDLALALREMHPIVCTAFWPGGELAAFVAVCDIPYEANGERSDPTEWTFQLYTDWKGSPSRADFGGDQEKIRAFFFDRIGKVAEPFSSAGLLVDPDIPLPVDDGINFKPIGDFEWDNHHGCATLAGDSAHSMLPHRGQGLNNAIMDASELVDAIKAVVAGDKSLQEAINAYEAEMRPRGSEEVDLSRQQAEASSKQEGAAKDFDKLLNSPMAKIGYHKPAAT